MKHIWSVFWAYVLKGVLYILPTAVSVYLIYFSFSLLRNILKFARVLIPEDYRHITYIQYGTELTALFLLILFIMLTGILVRTFVGKKIHQFIENILNRLPILNTVYNSLTQFVRLMSPNSANKMFSKVVLIDYPLPGKKAMAFDTGKAPESIVPDKKQKYVTVFVPTTPNPTSGFTLIVPEKDIDPLKMKTEEALKFLISSGILEKIEIEDPGK